MLYSTIELILTLEGKLGTMTNMMRQKHRNMGTVCNGTDRVIMVGTRTGDTKGWFININRSRGYEGWPID